MTDTSLRCYQVSQVDAKNVSGRVTTVTLDELPPGEVVVRVAWSSLNYKDALAATGHRGVVRRLPHVPGVDAAGAVIESNSPNVRVGDEVIVTGRGLGADCWGGWCEQIRVPSEWITPLPEHLSLKEAMIYGTAGFTAAQCVVALEQHGVTPDSGEVVVTGATGGVGCLSVMLLAKLGYRVVAVTGKQDAEPLLKQWGAAEVVGRDAVQDTSDKPLLRSRWAGAVDTVGGDILTTILRSTNYRGCVTACGLVAGVDLPLTVYPFILRGVTLAGIDSALCPTPQRHEIWRRLAGPWKPAGLESLATTVPLDGLPEQIDRILAGQVTGRVVVEPK